MDISKLNPGTSKFERTLFLKNENESNFIAWLNNFVMDPQFFTSIDEQYVFFIVDPKIRTVVTFPSPVEGIVDKSGNSYLVAWPQPIDKLGRPPYKFQWVLMGCLSKYNADGSVNVAVKTIEAVKVKSFKVADRLRITISTEYKLIEDLYLPGLLEAIEKDYPGSTLSDTPPAEPIHMEIEEITDTDKLILRWVNRERYAPGKDMDTFLSEDPIGNKFSSDQFKKVLSKAGMRGLIKKNARRWVSA